MENKDEDRISQSTMVPSPSDVLPSSSPDVRPAELRPPSVESVADGEANNLDSRPSRNLRQQTRPSPLGEFVVDRSDLDYFIRRLEEALRLPAGTLSSEAQPPSGSLTFATNCRK